MGKQKRTLDASTNRLFDKSGRKLKWFLLAFVILLLIAIPSARPIFGTIAGIVVIAIIINYMRRKSRIEKGDFYEIEHKHTEGCGRMNNFRYLKGSPPHGVTVKCWYCGRNYTR